MSDDPTLYGHAPERRASGSFPQAPRTISRSLVANGSAVDQDTHVRPMRAIVITLVVVLTVGLAAAWAFVAQNQLATAAETQATSQLDHARKVFQLVRSGTQDHLRSQCRVMVEDPRLKSTLYDGVDEATVADILNDLGKLRRSGFLIVLSPDGRVFAQSGAEELRGLDLSGSSVVKAAQSAREAVGSWVIRGQVLDLSIMAMRFGPSVVAYLVVGQPVNQQLLDSVADQTGVELASVSTTGVVLASSADDSMKSVFAGAAAQGGTFPGRRFEAGGQAYVAAAFELDQIAPADQRLIAVRSIAGMLPSSDTLVWMIRGVPLLMLVAIVFAMIASRRIIVVSRSRRSR